VVRGLARRWDVVRRGARRFDVIYLEYEALPYAPFWVEEELFNHRARVVVDYDDPVSLRYECHRNRVLRRALAGKIAEVVRRSCRVITANRNLESWARRLNPAVAMIPTSVDLRRYPWPPAQRSSGSAPVIGWIGTPLTTRFLRAIAEPLRHLRQRCRFVLKVIGAPGFVMDDIEVDAVTWSEASEVSDLRTCDIGIMPIPDDPWGHGKSALKLIQYLAAGSAAVASAVGANCQVVQNGVNGLLATSDREWTESLETLLGQPECRARLAEAGRHTVEESFSLQANRARFVNIFKEAAAT
jgi:glycosyltransferase involved in cell wall biosynthesis